MRRCICTPDLRPHSERGFHAAAGIVLRRCVVAKAARRRMGEDLVPERGRVCATERRSTDQGQTWRVSVTLHSLACSSMQQLARANGRGNGEW